jgi:5-methylcytosine-specific restriction protein A
VVDHIQPHRGEWSRFVDVSNLQSLCKFHHDRKTALEQARDRREVRAF